MWLYRREWVDVRGEGMDWEGARKDRSNARIHDKAESQTGDWILGAMRYIYLVRDLGYSSVA